MHTIFIAFSALCLILQYNFVDGFPFLENMNQEMDTFKNYDQNNQLLIDEAGDVSGSRNRIVRMPFFFSEIDVQDCPPGTVLHPSKTHCIIIADTTENGGDNYG
ncbi:unnamed protein product [Orchesella dallaii]|uniref:Uncharacterized protein n=1 Tax=Orchesella dallaii TaxID=48710 RepID=A0ABP1PYS1_9HEXA